jgi:hypothetical protein
MTAAIAARFSPPDSLRDAAFQLFDTQCLQAASTLASASFVGTVISRPKLFVIQKGIKSWSSGSERQAHLPAQLLSVFLPKLPRRPRHCPFKLRLHKIKHREVCRTVTPIKAHFHGSSLKLISSPPGSVRIFKCKIIYFKLYDHIFPAPQLKELFIEPG